MSSGKNTLVGRKHCYTYLWCNARSCSLVINLINWTLNYKHSSENITLKKFASVPWMGKVHSLGRVVFTWIWYIVKGIWNFILLYHIVILKNITLLEHFQIPIEKNRKNSQKSIPATHIHVLYITTHYHGLKQSLQ